jgi:predicted short-subunit dehydrogenase-like oxidoreductase (DUF2520 family)
VGAGTLASALARALRKRKYQIREIISRPGSLDEARALAKTVKARATTLEAANLDADLTWICVPDDAIAQVASQLAGRANWTRKTVLHSSGALASDVLAPLKSAGAEVASAHPLMTFVADAAADFTRVPFALEGDPKALTIAAAIVRDIGGNPFRIDREHKAAYHAFGFFVSPLLVALIATAQQVGALAGLPEDEARALMQPIVRQTIDNIFANGPQAAFSGPLKRGDVDTIRKHLAALAAAPALLDVYRSLARIALERLPVANQGEIAKLLAAIDTRDTK